MWLIRRLPTCLQSIPDPRIGGEECQKFAHGCAADLELLGKFRPSMIPHLSPCRARAFSLYAFDRRRTRVLKGLGRMRGHLYGSGLELRSKKRW